MGNPDQRRSVQVHGPGLYSRPVRVLICPDKFRGTLSAQEAAGAIGRGWSRARPADEEIVVPLADGGEGTLDVLVPPDDPGCRRVRVQVHGPLGEPVPAEFGMREDTAVVESARASGLALVPSARRDPMRAGTRGTGELMLAALDEGARRILVCLGGSATSDGGTGMASALGATFSAKDGSQLAEGGAAVLDLARIDLSGLDHRLRDAEVIGLTDVDNPLCGPNGASIVYGPQKGASEADAVLLDRALGHLAASVHHDLGIDLKDEPGAGAAGGLGFGLAAFCGARLRPGAAEVMHVVGFDADLAEADLVVTGEGSLDTQSLRGKVASAVLEAAAIAGVRVAILCGRAEVRPDGLVVRTLVDRFGEGIAMVDAARSLEVLAEELAHDAEVVPA